MRKKNKKLLIDTTQKKLILMLRFTVENKHRIEKRKDIIKKFSRA